MSPCRVHLTDRLRRYRSSTVVGAAILAALSAAKHTLPSPEEKAKAGKEEDVTMADAEPEVVNVADRIRGEERLVDHPVDLAAFAPPSADLLDKAARSARKCVCEGRSGTSPLTTYVCTSCGHTTCEACMGRPQHHYEADSTERIAPDVFEAELKKRLPMRFKLDGFSLEAISKRVATLKEAEVPVAKGKDAYFEAIAEAVDSVEVR